MFRSGVLHLIVAAAFCVGAGSADLAAQQQKSPDESNDQSDNFDVRSIVGDLYVGKDADAEKAGLPLYPGARPKQEKDNDPLNFGILTESFGLKLVVAKYESDDTPDKILAFYRGKLKKYGKVLECHNLNDNSGSETDAHAAHPKVLKCEGDNSGPVRELKVGTEDNARIVAVEPGDGGKGSTFTIVYLYKRGKQADI
jgi:hypothetical protein